MIPPVGFWSVLHAQVTKATVNTGYRCNLILSQKEGFLDIFKSRVFDSHLKGG